MIGASNSAAAIWGAIELDLPRGYRGGAHVKTRPDQSRPPRSAAIRPAAPFGAQARADEPSVCAPLVGRDRRR